MNQSLGVNWASGSSYPEIIHEHIWSIIFYFNINLHNISIFKILQRPTIPRNYKRKTDRASAPLIWCREQPLQWLMENPLEQWQPKAALTGISGCVGGFSDWLLAFLSKNASLHTPSIAPTDQPILINLLGPQQNWAMHFWFLLVIWDY